jgi:hypothetical protein
VGVNSSPYHDKKVNQYANGIVRSLGRNYIAQHRFKEALDLANKAL